MLPTSYETVLFLVAVQRRPRVSRWWGTMGGGTRKYAECYICDTKIDTWAAKWPVPVHARKAITEHRDYHVQDLTKKGNN